MSLQRSYTSLLQRITKGKIYFFIAIIAVLLTLILIYFLKPLLIFKHRVRILTIYINSEISPNKIDVDRMVKDIESNNYDGILFVINSPGGTLDILRIIYALKKTKVPKFCYINGEATSAAYWLCVQANYIIARPDSIVGNVGAYIEIIDLSNLLRKLGINVTIIKSTPYKDIGSPYRPLTEFERRYFQSLVDNITKEFVHDVISKRNISKNISISGLWFLADEAKSLNLIDDIGEFDKMKKYIAKYYNVSEDEIVFINRNYEKEKPWYSFLFNFKGFIESIIIKPYITKIFI